MKNLIVFIACFSLQAAAYRLNCRSEDDVRGWYDICLRSETAKTYPEGPNEHCMRQVNSHCPKMIGKVSATMNRWSDDSKHAGYVSLSWIENQDEWGLPPVLFDHTTAERLKNETSLPIEYREDGYWLPKSWFNTYHYFKQIDNPAFKLVGLKPCLDNNESKKNCEAVTYIFYGFNKWRAGWSPQL